MNIKYPLLIPVIGHGATDIITFPLESVLLNIVGIVLIKNINLNKRKIILTSASILHILDDFPFKKNYKKLIISGIYHILWLKKPIIAKLHLALFHTPLHYIRIYYSKIKYKEKFITGFLTSIIGSFVLNKGYDKSLDKIFGELWWVSPILTHIFLTNIYKIKFQEFYNNKYINNLHFKKIISKRIII
jgi:hypothetical protein